MLKHPDMTNTSYHITETARSTFAVVERMSLNHSGSHWTEFIVGEYRLAEEAEEHLARANERLCTPEGVAEQANIAAYLRAGA